MTNYGYEIIENGYYETTESWQNAIDLFNQIAGQGKSPRINVYKLLCKEYVRKLKTHTDIHLWSEILIDEMPNNRIEKRIMTDLLNKEPQERHSQHIMNMEAEYQAEIEWSEGAMLANDEPSKVQELWSEGAMLANEENEILKDEMLCSLDECSTEIDLDDDVQDKYAKLNLQTDFHGDFSGMSDEVKDSIINPKHYKIFDPEDYAKYPDGIEYMDLCDKALAHLSGVESHLVGQIFKYALRVGKKDAMEQDATKIEWYASRLVNTVKGNTPTKVRSDAEVVLKEDLTEVADLIRKAYARLSKTSYWASEDLDDISERIEEVMYDLTTNEVFND